MDEQSSDASEELRGFMATEMEHPVEYNTADGHEDAANIDRR